MAPQVHAVAQDSAHFDDAPFGDTIEQKMTSTPAVPGNMERMEARHDLVACV